MSAWDVPLRAHDEVGRDVEYDAERDRDISEGNCQPTEGTGGRQVMHLGASSVVFFGLAFARAWLSLVFIEPEASLGETLLPHGVFDLGFVGFNVALIVLARRMVPLSDRRGWYVFALLGMLLASACSGCALWFEVPVWVAWMAALAAGTAYGAYVVLNSEAYAGVSILRMVLYLSGSQALGSVVAAALQGGGAWQTVLALAVLPVVAVGFARSAYLTLDARERQKPVAVHLALPWKLIVLTCLFSFVYGLRSTALAAGAGQHSSLSTALIMGGVFALAYYLPDRVDVRTLCRAPVLMMASGLLLVPGDFLFGQTVSSYLVSASYTLFGFVVAVVLYDLAKRASMPIAPLVAASEGTQLFVQLGGLTSHAIEHAPIADITVALVSAVVLLAAFALLFSERELAGRWGVRVLQESLAQGDSDPVALLMARCAEFARTHGLTPREEEVLRELALRKDTRDIADDLLIAPGTLRAHTRHIYEKAGIHSREELYGMLGVEG